MKRRFILPTRTARSLLAATAMLLGIAFALASCGGSSKHAAAQVHSAVSAELVPPGGAAVSWGENFFTQLGVGYKDIREETPGPIVGLNNITAIASGTGFSIALLSDGTVSAWGVNLGGQLADGSRTGTWEKDTPHVTVSGLSGVKAISAANGHSLALLTDGRVAAFGTSRDGQYGNGNGGLETETGEDVTHPHTVNGLTGVTAIASGGASNYALLENGTVMAWGRDNVGQLGVGEVTEECHTEAGLERCSKVPRQVIYGSGARSGDPVSEVAAISGGDEAGYALLRNGHVLSWGNDGKRQLGTGAKVAEEEKQFHPPAEVLGVGGGGHLENVKAISGGAAHALALLNNGEVVGWGGASSGDLGGTGVEACGRALCDPVPVKIAGLKAVEAIAAGYAYSVALSGGKVYTFGRNEDGELGNGGTVGSNVPTPVKGLRYVAQIAAGPNHAIALFRSGVNPPAPLLRVKPGVRSLKLIWRFIATEYKVRYRPFGVESREFSPMVTLPESASSYVFKGLTQIIPYAVVIKTPGKERAIVGTPLP